MFASLFCSLGHASQQLSSQCVLLSWYGAFVLGNRFVVSFLKLNICIEIVIWLWDLGHPYHFNACHHDLHSLLSRIQYSWIKTNKYMTFTVSRWPSTVYHWLSLFHLRSSLIAAFASTSLYISCHNCQHKTHQRKKKKNNEIYIIIFIILLLLELGAAALSPRMTQSNVSNFMRCFWRFCFNQTWAIF